MYNKQSVQTYANIKSKESVLMFFMLIVCSPDDSLLQKLYKLSMEQQGFPEYQPHDYSSEGTNVGAVSLDKLSFHTTGEDLEFLENLGPKFCTLSEICPQGIKEKRDMMKL